MQLGFFDHQEHLGLLEHAPTSLVYRMKWAAIANQWFKNPHYQQAKCYGIRPIRLVPYDGL
jgi:hypothetical protein